MHTSSKELQLQTSHVAYFKKWLMNQSNIYSFAKITYSADMFIMHGTSTLENIMLCNTILPDFFEIYQCDVLDKTTIEVNMFHLYRIIGLASSFRYNYIHITIHHENSYKMMTISFETENKVNRYHIRCGIVDQSQPITDRLPKQKETYVKITLDGTVFASALSKFETDVFQTISFSIQQNEANKAVLAIGTQQTDMLTIRGKTDMMKGFVCVQFEDNNNNIHLLKEFKKNTFSIETLLKCLHFYHLANQQKIHFVFYLQSNILMLYFNMKHGGHVEALIPSLKENMYDLYSSSSDSD